MALPIQTSRDKENTESNYSTRGTTHKTMTRSYHRIEDCPYRHLNDDILNSSFIHDEQRFAPICLGQDVCTNAFVIVMKEAGEYHLLLPGTVTDASSIMAKYLSFLETNLKDNPKFPKAKEYQRHHLRCCVDKKDFEKLGVCISKYRRRRTLYRHRETKLLVSFATNHEDGEVLASLPPRHNIEDCPFKALYRSSDQHASKPDKDQQISSDMGAAVLLLALQNS